MSDNDLYEQMRADLDSGECAVIDPRGDGYLCGRLVARGEFDHVLTALKTRMDDTGFWPNIYSINDHGNVSLLDGDGNEVASWV